MKKFLRISLTSLVASALVYFGAALAMAFWPEPSFAAAPFPATSFASAEFASTRYTMRDGETLFARHFPADSDKTILLLHGVTAESAAFNVTAPLLQQATGAEVIAIDLRGHGRSGGQSGHVDYIGQYEDDVADVLAALRAERPDNQLILAGHSMGGGIALRYAELANRPAVDGYLMFAPHLGANAPTLPEPDPEAVAAYSHLNVPRLIGLIMLNNVGITGLNHLDTLRFNLTDEATHTYSFGATANTSPQDYVSALSAIDAPLLVVVGREDEAFVADAFDAAITAHSNGVVHVIDDENHTSILASEPAITLIADWLNQMHVAANN